MNTTLNAMLDRDKDYLHARRSADMLYSVLQDFIPHACRREALDRLGQALIESKLELVPLAQRKQLETLMLRGISGDFHAALIIPMGDQLHSK